MTKIISEGFCIGCGNCEIKIPTCFSMQENKLGLIEAKCIDDKIDDPSIQNLCPVTSIKSEDYFNGRYKSESISYHKEIGYFRNIYAGFVNDEPTRLDSSSGGLTTHIIEILFSRNLITGALVVGASPNDHTRTEYYIARSIKELRQSKKSKYHMTSYNHAVKELLESLSDESLAFVGVPCAVKAIKLLGEEIPEIKEKIKYHISIFCGHQKSHAFTEFVAWQMDVPPNELLSIDYRVKKKGNDASRYCYRVTGTRGSSEKSVDGLKWMDWGLGLFKPKACDFCDDVTGETADIIIGDAWSRKYSKDYRGTNLVITRTREMDEILALSSQNGLATLFKEKVSFVFATQGGNFRHRHDGLISRKNQYEKNDMWLPPKDQKRIARYCKDDKRDKLYIERHRISTTSHEAFLKAKELNDLAYFWENLEPKISKYYQSSDSFYKKTKKIIKKFISIL